MANTRTVKGAEQPVGQPVRSSSYDPAKVAVPMLRVRLDRRMLALLDQVAAYLDAHPDQLPPRQGNYKDPKSGRRGKNSVTASRSDAIRYAINLAVRAITS